MLDERAGEGRVASALAAVDPHWDAARVERALAGLDRRRRRRRTVASVAIVAGVALVLVVARLGSMSSPAPSLAHAPAAPPRLAPTESPLRFADGSFVTPAPDGEVVVDAVSDERIALRLIGGAIDVEVSPHPERPFEIDCGAVRISVLGTGFHVARRGASTWVAVTHGRVRVSWEGGARELGVGEAGLFPIGHGGPSDDAPVEAALPVSPVPVALARAPHVAASPPTTQVAAVASDWRPLAERGEYDAAYAALTASGSDDVGDEVETLLLAADAARLSGHGVEALPFLERAAEHEDDPRSLLASFTRGRLLLTLGRPAEAAQVLEGVLDRAPTGALAEDAIARAIEAHVRAGDTARARELARRYLDEHPEGRWADRARSVLEAEEPADER